MSQPNIKKQSSLVDTWNGIDDEELGSFIRLVSGVDIPKFTLDEFDKKESVDTRRLNAILNHRLFKLLMENRFFDEAYGWLDEEYARNGYKALENRHKLITCMVIPFTIYARHVGGKKPLLHYKESSKATKQINKKAKALLEAIEEHEKTLDVRLKDCCDGSLSRLKYMAEYQLVKAPRQDSTYDERAYLQELVGWLCRYNLQRSPKFIGSLLGMLGQHQYQPSYRKLLSDIKIYEIKYQETSKQNQKDWE